MGKSSKKSFKREWEGIDTVDASIHDNSIAKINIDNTHYSTPEICCNFVFL